jgi:Uri superfamily endonuclease
MVSKGTYCLYISVQDTIIVRIGALGELKFEKGYYVYVGSALNSLEPRIIRHLKVSREEHRVIHWHIDYLLKEKDVQIEKVYLKVNGEKQECNLAEKVLVYGEPIKKFGCSDCKCMSHLFRVKDYKFLEKIGLEKYF